MRYELFIAARYLKAKRQSSYTTIISLISVGGVCIGVAALIIVLAVMNGFRADIEDKILGIHPHLVIDAGGDPMPEQEDDVIASIMELPHVEAAQKVVQGKATISFDDNVEGLLIKGMEDDREKWIINLEEYLNYGLPDLVTETETYRTNYVIIGSDLARKLHVDLWDTVFVSIPTETRITIMGAIPRLKKFVVGGLFDIGIYEYNNSVGFIHLEAAQTLFKMSDQISGVEVKIDDPHQAERVATALRGQLGPTFRVQTWMDLNATLFSALKLEKFAMFVVLLLIILVAAFNIVSTMIMIVMEKTNAIGILKSMGATAQDILRIFVLEGLIIGIVGSTVGVLLGYGISFALSKYQIPLPTELVFIESLPVKVVHGEVALIASCAVLITFLAAIYPARQAASLDAVDAIRLEL